MFAVVVPYDTSSYAFTRQSVRDASSSPRYICVKKSNGEGRLSGVEGYEMEGGGRGMKSFVIYSAFRPQRSHESKRPILSTPAPNIHYLLLIDLFCGLCCDADIPEHPRPDSFPRQGQARAYEKHHRQLLRHGRAAGKKRKCK